MGKTLVYKILEEHLVEGELVPGQEVGIRIDQTLTQDATGTMAYLQFEAMGLERVKTELSVSYIDHNTLQDGFENADDHRYLMGVARKIGVHLSKAGNGICHQVHLERFGVPGKTLLGSDSHTPTGGGIGMIAIGAGGLDVAVAMGGGPFFLVAPKVINVRLTGKLQPFVSAKDVILKVLEILTTKGNVGCVAEYGGPGVATLSVPERATITNMGAELGVTTSVFPSDDTTRAFLEAQGRGKLFRPLTADADAKYDRVIDIDLGQLEPLMACPHSPDNIKSVRSLAGTKIDQVLIGSCTNASVKDLQTVAAMVDGRSVDTRVSFGVAPGSRQVLRMVAEDGSLAKIVASGARILESTCGFCIGAGQAPQTNGISVRSNNRNFEGRSGTASGQIYLASPESCVAAALKGVITDPRDLGIAPLQVEMPRKFVVDDSMILAPASPADATQVEIIRGPNIGQPPTNDRLPDNVSGEALLKLGDKITTDHIMPAGPYLKYRSNVDKYASVVFVNVDQNFSKRAKELKQKGGHGIIVAGLSYGQGSSREHAAMCPMYLGVKAVIAKQIERIHGANLVNFGIAPLFFKNEADYDGIAQGDKLAIKNFAGQIKSGASEFKVDNESKGTSFVVTTNISERQRKNLLAGGLLNATRG